MELPVSPKSPKRQVTLGPDAPIREWEVERATVNKKIIIIHSLLLNVLYKACNRKQRVQGKGRKT
jgi:hypothetical protein